MKKNAAAEIDIVGFMAKIQEQLAMLDQKLDTFMTKSLNELAQVRAASLKPAVVPASSPRPALQARPPENPQRRPTFRATCADCRKDCEVPFKPTGDRPVYCKECFARRKASGQPKNNVNPKPSVQPVAPVTAMAVAQDALPVTKEKKPSSLTKKTKKKSAPAKKAKKK